MTDLTAPHFTDEDKAREHLEALRWPTGPFCPHCGSFNATRLQGQKHRKGAIQCNDCREQFTVTVGTVFERSKVPLNKWLLANHLMCSSKKGVSAHQIHRMLGVTYKTAWFMCHRIREAMRDVDDTPFGQDGGIVEVDETFIGRERGVEKRQGGVAHKMKVLSLIDRNTGRAKSVVIDDLKTETIRPILVHNIVREAKLMTDQAQYYKQIGREFTVHMKVDHGRGEYVNLTDRAIHTNTVESFFGIFKRGMKGIYQHCAKKHLHRYLAEFDFRYSNRSAQGIEDAERAALALKGIYGKRLTYRRIGFAAA